MENKRQKIEIADIFRSLKSDYYQQYSLSQEQKKTFNAVINCRSQKLGGYSLKCNNCGHIEHAYNSCRNRHCPKCQYLKQIIWVDKLKARLLPVKYFHIVFTIPGSLHKLFYANQGICYDLLIKSASQAILKAGENPSFLGAKTGCVAILHTWGQALTYHPHVHILVPAGGFDDDMVEWIHTRKKFFAPVNVLASLFRGIFAENICNLSGELVAGNSCEKTDIVSLKTLIYKTNWNVYAKPALNSTAKVIEYLGRYTHRVAISNSRIVNIVNDSVLFRWKDYRKGGKTKIMKLKAVEFINRFLMHVLPCGFYKIRYYGIFANKLSGNLLDTYLVLNGQEMDTSVLEGKCWQEIVQDTLGYNPFHCSICKKGIMIWQNNIIPQPRAA